MKITNAAESKMPEKRKANRLTTGVFARSGLKELVEQCRGRCVSIYMPTYKTGDTQQNPIRLRNLLREAEERLVKAGLRRPLANKMLAPVVKLIDDSFWRRHQSDGLAIFVGDGFFRHYLLEVQLKELVVVAARFHIKPLIPIFSFDSLYYVLALSQKKVRLLECTRFGVKEIDYMDAFPRSLAEFLKYDELDRQLQYHLHSGVPAAGQETVTSHGREISEEDKINLLRYFQQIDKGLAGLTGEQAKAPLVLAGVEYLFAIYKEANTYPNLLKDGISGNPDNLSAADLHRKAGALLEPHFDRLRRQESERYQHLKGTGLATDDLKTIVTAAYAGKIESLFVSSGWEQWGTFDPAAGTLDLHTGQESCDEDLLDFAAAHTMAHRGAVYMTEREKIPDGLPVAAILRH